MTVKLVGLNVTNKKADVIGVELKDGVAKRIQMEMDAMDCLVERATINVNQNQVCMISYKNSHIWVICSPLGYG